MLVSVKSSHKAYLAHIEEERKNEDSQKRKSSEEKQQEREAKRRKEEELKKIDGLRKSIKELDERESKSLSWHRRSRKKQSMNWKQCKKRNER